MKLFKPWRLESDLCLPEKTFSQSFATESSRLPEMAAHHDHSIKAEQQEEQMANDVRQRELKRCVRKM